MDLLPDALNPAEWVKDFLADELLVLIETGIDALTEVYEATMDMLEELVMRTPTDFSPGLVETLRTISDVTIVPLAGLLLTYFFCYQIYEMVVEKNRGSEFEIGQIIFLIIKTSVIILLITHAFDIALAFTELGQWIIRQIPASAKVPPVNIKDMILDSLEDTSVGGMIYMSILTFVSSLLMFFMYLVVYLVAWSRIITLLLHVSIAPFVLPWIVSNSWIGSMGQNYFKNMLALMLQGFFMAVLLIIYGHLMEYSAGEIQSSPIVTMITFLGTTGIIVVMLTRTHSLAKSAVGAN